MKPEMKVAAKIFEEEPKKNKKLLELKNMITTSQMWAQTEETQKKASIQIAKKVIEALERTAS